MTNMNTRRWLVRSLLIIGIVLALVAAAPKAEASFRLSIGTGGFYFAVGHHDYYPYYGHRASYGGGYASSSFSFHNSLSDYGYWQYDPGMGVEVWVPYVEYGWRPYTYGHWTYSSYGWTWVAYEPWGWIPHHYGNWAYTDHFGWAWIPGYTWRPHCVEFALVNGYIGWAPVAPPWHRYSYNRGYRYHGDRGWYSGWRHGHRHYDYSGIDYNAYVFVDNRHFYGSGIHQHALLPGVGVDMFRAGNVMPLGDTLDLGYVKNVTGRSIAPVALDRQVYSVNGSEVMHYQPRGQEQLVRGAALSTVNQALAPGFQKHGVKFKGTSANSAGQVNSLFNQTNKSPKTSVFTRASVSKGMTSDAYYQKQKQTLDNLTKTSVAKGASSTKTTGRSSGYKARTGTSSNSGKATSSQGRSMNSGKSTASQRRSMNSGKSTSSQGRSMNSGKSTSSQRRSMNSGKSTSSQGRSMNSGKSTSSQGRSMNSGKSTSSQRRSMNNGKSTSSQRRSMSSGKSTSSQGRSMNSGKSTSSQRRSMSSGKSTKPAGTRSSTSSTRSSGKSTSRSAGKSSGGSTKSTKSQSSSKKSGSGK